MTLTTRRDSSPTTAEKTMRKAAPRLWTKLRAEFGPQEYVRFCEECKDGYPHYHFLVRGTFLPQDRIRTIWKQLTGATIIDIRKAHGKSIRYVSKYCAKAANADGAFSRQRVAVSKHFWTPDTRESEFLGFNHHRQHPVPYAAENFTHTTATEVRPGVYAIHMREPGDELPWSLTPAIWEDTTP